MKPSKPGRPPSGKPPEYTRSIRMNDERWSFFKSKLGLEWLREKIDLEMKRSNKQVTAQTTDQ